MTLKRIDKNHYLEVTTHAPKDFTTKYYYEPFENADHSLVKKHRDDGPAIIADHPRWGKTLYWYNKDVLVATIETLGEHMSIFPDGKDYNLIRIPMPENFKGREESITLQEMEEFSNQAQIKILQEQSNTINDRITKLREKMTPNTTSDLKP